jgi:predicted ArsR family transcriptional regulator
VSIPPPDRAEEGQRFGPSRSRVLAVLRDLGGPATAAEIGARLGAHPNTARFHLEALVAAGVVSREREERTTPGRPRTHYVAEVAAPQAGQRSYRLLADILATHVARSAVDPPRDAADAGRTFGRLAVPAGERPRSVAAAADLVVDTLSGMGFESRAAVEGDGARIDVTTCPFLEVATQHLDVVCAVHRGLMEGLLEHVEAAVDVESLEPLVAPSHCVARLARRGRRAGRDVRRSSPVPAR